MTITLRHYTASEDFQLIGDFLIENYQPDNLDGNWLQPAWEYMHCHPALDESALDKIGIWEEAGKIVGVVHYESEVGEVFFELHPDYASLRLAMLAYAESHLWGTTAGRQCYVRVYINDFDRAFEKLAQAQGYRLTIDHQRPMSQFILGTPFSQIELPEGFQLKSLQEANDLHQIQRVLWGGFNHAGEPPTEGLAGTLKMQSGPGFRKDLNMVVMAANGDFVAYSGLWYDALNRLAYVEPVATVPEFRRLGLGRAAVLAGIQRCEALGATVAYVGSDLDFYRAHGFKKLYTSRCWTKYLAAPEKE